MELTARIPSPVDVSPPICCY